MKEKIQNTRNIKFCAYLKMRDYHPIEIKVIGKGKAEYMYRINDEMWKILKIDFNQSDFSVYASNLESIKDMAY